MKIVSIADGGPAAVGSLRVGDIIIGVGNTPVTSFNELRAALEKMSGDVDIVFLNGENGKLEKLPIKVMNGKIGVNVEEVRLPTPPPAQKDSPTLPPVTNS